jgi:hypothetical protein
VPHEKNTDFVSGVMVLRIELWGLIRILVPWGNALSLIWIYGVSRDTRWMFGFILPADVEGGDAFSRLEWDIHSDLLYYRDLLVGDLDSRLNFESDTPLNGGGMDLPNQLFVLSVDNRWTWRYVNDVALQWRFEPGFYTALDSLGLESLSVPMTFSAIKTFSERLAAVAGVAVRFGFEREVMPVAGVVWQPQPDLRVEAMFPESRLTYYWQQGWALHARWAWDSITYQLPDDSADRRRVTFESTAYGAGVTRELSPEFRVFGELGMLTAREVEFDRGGKGDIDDALYMRAGIGGAF